ncbi:MAG TPA: hypothetical protein ENN03_08245 [bacterium]|nr:hypothetical protein [bacterium]
MALYIRNLIDRAGTAVIGIPVIVLCALQGGWVFSFLVIGIILLALYELFNMLRQMDYSPLMIGGALISITVSMAFTVMQIYQAVAGIFLLIGLALTLELFLNRRRVFINSLITLGGVVYIGLLNSLLLIRNHPFLEINGSMAGGLLVLLLFTVLWSFDISAYVFGSAMGKHPLFSRISPGKSWEGSIMGLIFSTLTAFIFRTLFLNSLPLVHTLGLALTVGITGQLGDLVESLFKREALIKDSSRLLPGHGGILDRFDSTIFAAPSFYAYLIFFGI